MLLSPLLLVEAKLREQGRRADCPTARKDLRMWSWHMSSRHLALSGRREVELAWIMP